MKEIIILKGLPASGKTTWANAQLKQFPGKYKRVNKDSLRDRMDGGKWSRKNEEFVIKTRNELIDRALYEGYSVIVDDTNLSAEHETVIRNIASAHSSVQEVQVTVKSFDVSLEECLKRDSERAKPVGRNVILRMYNQYLRPTIAPVVWNPDLPAAIICDLDGTLAIHNGRDPHDTARCGEDLINHAIWKILNLYMAEGDEIILVTGREDTYRPLTEEWLKDQGVTYNKLLMRKGGDHRRDNIIKKKIYEAEIKGKYNVRFVLDDRQRVVDMWREQGLLVLQVADGDY